MPFIIPPTPKCITIRVTFNDSKNPLYPINKKPNNLKNLLTENNHNKAITNTTESIRLRRKENLYIPPSINASKLNSAYFNIFSRSVNFTAVKIPVNTESAIIKTSK